MASDVYPPATSETGERRRALAPEIHRAFDEFSRQVFAGNGRKGAGGMTGSARPPILPARQVLCLQGKDLQLWVGCR